MTTFVSKLPNELGRFSRLTDQQLARPMAAWLDPECFTATTKPTSPQAKSGAEA